MLTYFRVYTQTDAVMLEDVGEIGETTYQALRKFLLYGTKAKMENGAETWGLLLLSGPKAASVINAAFGTDVGDLKPINFISATIGGQTALIIMTEETGERDYEVLIPADGLQDGLGTNHGGRRSAWHQASRQPGPGSVAHRGRHSQSGAGVE